MTAEPSADPDIQSAPGLVATDTTAHHPYLILTLRRTGGTSLMGFLSQCSAFPTVQHEPFNKQRMWGAITEEFRRQYRGPGMQAALAQILAKRPNIKHCVELVPSGLTRTLVHACLARDYRIFLLTRRDEIARLRSMCIAQATDAWGRRQVDQKYPDILAGTVQLPPVDLQKLVSRAQLDARILARIRAMLHADSIPFDDLVFEDIYARDDKLALRACAIAARLGIVVTPDDPRLETMLEPYGVSSSAILPYLPNAEAFEETLQQIGRGETRAGTLGTGPNSLGP